MAELTKSHICDGSSHQSVQSFAIDNNTFVQSFAIDNKQLLRHYKINKHKQLSIRAIQKMLRQILFIKIFQNNFSDKCFGSSWIILSNTSSKIKL